MLSRSRSLLAATRSSRIKVCSAQQQQSSASFTSSSSSHDPVDLDSATAAASSTTTASSSSLSTPAADQDQDQTQTQGQDEPSKQGSGNGYRAWLAGDGLRYRSGLPGKTNWLGDTPFPMNPNFSPLAPLADATKEMIYNAYLHNSLSSSSSSSTDDAVRVNSDSLVLRAVAAKFGVNMQRVRAVVRLKELEKEWKDQKRTLQTGLLRGMESHLGVTQPRTSTTKGSSSTTTTWKGNEDPEEPVRVLASNKTIFEMVDIEGGDSPVFLPLLAQAQRSSFSSSSASTTRKCKESAAAAAKVKVVQASRPGRAAIEFSDIGSTALGEQFRSTRNEGKTKRGNGGRVHRANIFDFQADQETKKEDHHHVILTPPQHLIPY